MEFIKVGETDVYYQHQSGNTPAGSIIFIHGSGSSHEVWSNQMKLGMNSIALDLPGHGKSGGRAAASIEESAKMAAEFLSALQLPRPLYLAGHSMGAAIAITCALEYPGLAEGIILIGAGQRMKVMPALLENLHQGINDPSFIRIGFSPQTPNHIVECAIKAYAEAETSVLYADFSACNNFDVSQQLEQIRLPVLVIAGADDKLTPVKLSEYICSHINHCQLAVISEAGHFIMLEKPAEVNQLIFDFVTK